jgi:hypothetical protein
LSTIKIMSGVALFLGIGSVTLGIVSLVYLGGAQYPVTSATGIWYGLMVSIKHVWLEARLPLRGKFADLTNLKVHCLRSILSVVCTLAVGAFSRNKDLK